MQKYELIGHTLARGGGGGSSSGGGFSGGGGGFSGGSSTYYGSDYSSNSNYSGTPVSFWFILLFFLPFIILFILIFLFTVFLAKKSKAGTASRAPNGFREAQTEEEKKLVENAKTCFEAFQKAW